MSYVEYMDDQYLKGAFRRITVVYSAANSAWQIQGDVPGGHTNLSGATDLASAMSAALTWLGTSGYQQITHWSDRSSTETKSVWFLPA